MQGSQPCAVAQSTPTGDAVARVVEQAYALGKVAECALLRRGFNHVYGLRTQEGGRVVARVCAERPRGLPNTAYEAALLAHLKAAGAGVAGVLAARDGSPSVTIHLPEGPRALMLFEHLDGDPPGEVLADVEATGRGLAQLHEAARDYRGPASRYVLELSYLLDASVRRLNAAPTMDDALRADFPAIADRLHSRISAMPALERVACHGDCHGSNNFMTDGPAGARIASFFDFDDCGPGYLAYELAVYLWAMLPRKPGGVLDDEQLARWRRYLAGYRGVRELAQVDFDAIAAFIAVRQLWLMGEYAGRIAVWGTQSMPTAWLRKQVELLRSWEALATPG